MKVIINLIRSALLHSPIETQLAHTDSYDDRSVVAVAGFGWAAVYVVTPDGETTSKLLKGDLSAGRRAGYAMRETAFGRWVRRASSADLLSTRDAELACTDPHLGLVKDIQRELDGRVGLKLAA